MFLCTDTAEAPWTVIKSNDKKPARLECMKHFLSGIDYPGKDAAVAVHPDPRIVASAGQVVHTSGDTPGPALHPDRRGAAPGDGGS